MSSMSSMSPMPPMPPTASHRPTALRRHSVMNRNETMALLVPHKPEVHRRFGEHSLALFGSWARGQTRPSSDVDMLVEFDGPAISARFFVPLLRPAISACSSIWKISWAARSISCPQALRAELRPFVERDAINV